MCQPNVVRILVIVNLVSLSWVAMGRTRQLADHIYETSVLPVRTSTALSSLLDLLPNGAGSVVYREYFFSLS